MLQEGVKVVLESVEQSAVEKHGFLAVDDDQVLQRLVVLVNEDKAEGLKYEAPFGDFVLSSSKGVYVRSVVHDMGQIIGCGAHLTRLRRTVSGKFKVSDAIPLAELKSLSKEDFLKRVIPCSEIHKMLAAGMR